MRFQDPRSEDVNIDLTPFIDVVFMLLLFFVVSTTLFKETTKLGVSLPQANTQKLENDNNRIEVGVNAQGFYFIDGKPVDGSELKDLKSALRKAMHNNNKLGLVLVGDKTAPHQAVVGALEVASELGITKVQIVAQARKEKPLQHR